MAQTEATPSASVGAPCTPRSSLRVYPTESDLSLKIQFNQINEPKRVELWLDGTILICSFRQWSGDVELQIPVELVILSKRKRFNIDLRRFGKRETIMLGAQGASTLMEAWNTNELESFFQEVEKRKLEVHETIPFLAREGVGFSDNKPSRRMILWMFLFLLPGMMLERLWLLFLAALPVLWFLYCRCERALQPAWYRNAARFLKKGKLAEAESQLKQGLEGQSSNVEAILLLTEVYVKQSRYDDALQAAQRLAEKNVELSDEIQQWIIQCKRIHARRASSNLIKEAS